MSFFALKAPPLAPAALAAAPLTDAFQQRLAQWLQDQGLLKQGRATKLIVAYSGGQDSTALLHALCQLRPSLNLDVVAAYYHHNWRGTPPPELARLHKNSLAYRVPLVFMPPKRQEAASEDSARKHRYQRLTQLAGQLKADAVLTAHHQDDQLETMVFRLLRGTGMDGLRGMPALRPLDAQSPQGTLLIRPLLGETRASIQAYVQQHQLLTFEDPTNEDTSKARSWLRHQALPLLSERFPQLPASLLRLSTLMENDALIVEQVIEQLWQQVQVPTATPTLHQCGGCLNVLQLNQWSLPYQRRLLRRYLQSLQLDAELTTLDALIAFLNKGALGNKAGQARRFSLGAKRSNLGGLLQGFVLHKGDRLWFEWVPERNAAAEAERQQIAVPCPLSGGCIEYPWQPLDASSPQALRMEPWPKRAAHFDVRKLPPTTQNEVFVNATAVEQQSLVLRVRRAGDWIRPMGMGGKRMKLKDLFIHHKIPQPLRATWPLIALEGSSEILWIPTLTLSESLRSTAKQSPTHTWMVGDAETLSQLRTLRILLDKEEDETADNDADTDASLLDEMSPHPLLADAEELDSLDDEADA